MCRPWPEAPGQAKPGQNKPGQAKPWGWPEGAFGLACDFLKPKPPAWALAFVGIYLNIFVYKFCHPKNNKSPKMTENAFSYQYKILEVSVGV